MKISIYRSGSAPKRERRQKKTKLPGQPKRYATAYFIWMNENRESIKSKFPGLSIAEFGKKSGELWKEMTDKSVSFLNADSSFLLCFKMAKLTESARFVYILYIVFASVS
jgi:hypothetical protein